MRLRVRRGADVSAGGGCCARPTFRPGGRHLRSGRRPTLRNNAASYQLADSNPRPPQPQVFALAVRRPLLQRSALAPCIPRSGHQSSISTESSSGYVSSSPVAVRYTFSGCPEPLMACAILMPTLDVEGWRAAEGRRAVCAPCVVTPWLAGAGHRAESQPGSRQHLDDLHLSAASLSANGQSRLVDVLAPAGTPCVPHRRRAECTGC